MNKAEILIIDDEEQIRKMLRITLTSNSYVTSEAATASEGMIMAENHPPDLVILDLGLPDKNGVIVLKELREWYTGAIIILSVENDEDRIIEALDLGANDYLTKPFRTGELLARMRSALRNINQEEDIDNLLVAGDLEIDLANRMVSKGGTRLKLTATEYNLLALMARNHGKVMTHAHLLRSVWGPGFINQAQYLRVFVAQIRKKIETDPNRPIHLLTESGFGYRFITNRESSHRD